MPKIEKSHLLLSFASGKFGDIVIKQYKYGTVLTKVPDMTRIKASKDQKRKRTKFAEAVAYAQEVLADPRKKSLMKSKVKKGSSIYHHAIREYLNKQSDQRVKALVRKA